MSATELRPVDIRSIEGELQKLWREQAGDATDPEHPLVAIHTLNLIIYSPQTAPEEMPALLDPLLAEHPARIIAIHAAPEEAPRAWISAARIRSVGLRRCIARELITIAASPENQRQLRSIVVPLLMHDLPVYLWWRGRPGFGGELFEDLARAADRIIIDSDEMDDPARDLARVADAVPVIGGAFSDLAWARLTPWRQLVVQFFNAPPLAPYLGRISHVVVEYGGALPARAMLLVAWLASRLGWTPGRGPHEDFDLVCRRGEQDVHIKFQRNAAAPAGLRSLRLTAADASFTVMRLRETGCFTTASEVAGKKLERRVPQADDSEPQMINRELDLPGRDLLYEQALAMARALLATETTP